MRATRAASSPAQAKSCDPVATNQPDGQITADFPKFESSQGIKNIPLNNSGKSPLQGRPVSPDERGGSRSSRTARWDAVDAGAAKDERRGLRTAKPCGPGAPMLASSRVEVSTRRWWQESPVTRESTE